MKLDAALDRLKKQDSAIAGYEAKMAFWTDMENCARQLEEELSTIKVALKQENDKCEDLVRTLKTKNVALWIFGCILIVVVCYHIMVI